MFRVHRLPHINGSRYLSDCFPAIHSRNLFSTFFAFFYFTHSRRPLHHFPFSRVRDRIKNVCGLTVGFQCTGLRESGAWRRCLDCGANPPLPPLASLVAQSPFAPHHQPFKIRGSLHFHALLIDREISLLRSPFPSPFCAVINPSPLLRFPSPTSELCSLSYSRCSM
jgi:hypothetical protein